MSSPLPTMALVAESRGQAARRRRESIGGVGVTRERLATEAGVSVKTIKSYEEDARENMPSGRRIEDALDRLEADAERGGSSPHRRRSDSPKHRLIEAAVQDVDDEDVTIKMLGNGATVILVVPSGARVSSGVIQRAIEDALPQYGDDEPDDDQPK